MNPTGSAGSSPGDARTIAKLLEHAWAVSDLLNDIQDDDDREAARMVFVRALNNQEQRDLFDRQAAADGLLANVIGLPIKHADQGVPDTAAEMKTLALGMHRASYGTPVPMSDRGTSAEPYADNQAKAFTMRTEGWGR